MIVCASFHMKDEEEAHDDWTILKSTVRVAEGTDLGLLNHHMLTEFRSQLPSTEDPDSYYLELSVPEGKGWSPAQFVTEALRWPHLRHSLT